MKKEFINSCHCRGHIQVSAGNPVLNKDVINKQTRLPVHAGNDNMTNKVILKGCYSGSLPYKRQSGRDAEYRLFSMTLLKRGFTLIELLVVVLIIGILATIALPQYQVAVMKSRVSALLPLMRSLKDAEEAYYLENGVYADRTDVLGVQVPPGNSLSSPGSAFYFYDNGTYIDALGSLKDSKDWYIMGVLKTGWNGSSCGLYMYLDHSPYPGRIACFGYGTDYPKCEQMCKSMGYEYSL